MAAQANIVYSGSITMAGQSFVLRSICLLANTQILRTSLVEHKLGGIPPSLCSTMKCISLL